jgi:hypothetical protein
MIPTSIGIAKELSFAGQFLFLEDLDCVSYIVLDRQLHLTELTLPEEISQDVLVDHLLTLTIKWCQNTSIFVDRTARTVSLIFRR